MFLKTPFIVQGPRYFLHNLKKLGFKTFEHWWDEGYAEDPDAHQVYEIQKVLDCLARTPQAELIDILDDMQQTLEHNYQRAMQLTDRDFHTINWYVQ